MSRNALPALDPYWKVNKRPHFYERTSTHYERTPWGPLFQTRGIHNPALNSLAAALPSGAILAGGFIMTILQGDGRKAGDIDIFFTGSDPYWETYNLFLNPPEEMKYWAWKEYTPSVTTENLAGNSRKIKLVRMESQNPERLPIQLIKMAWYNDAEHVIDSFDFTACQFAIDGADLVYNPLSMMDLFKQKLVPHRHHYPADTLYRLIKYTKKGFSASPATLVKIAVDIKNSKESDPPVLPFYDASP